MRCKMINSVPSFWDYNKDMETLYFFFQRSEEMLSKYTVDTYHVKMHNTLTLCEEALLIYNQLDKLKIIDEYYSKYICNILDEILYSIHCDEAIKQLLGVRLSSITTGINTAKNDSAVMKRWIEAVLDYCPSKKYIEINKKIICNSVIKNENKKELLKAMDRYYSQLIYIGYSEEYIYKKVKEFFAYGNSDNGKIIINDAKIIEEFLQIFDYKPQKYEFIILIDDKAINYFSELKFSDFDIINNIVYFEEKDIAQLAKYKYGLELVERYNDRQKSNENIKIIKYTTSDIDYYSALNEFDSFMNFIRSFESYFKHYTYYVNVYMAILKIKKSNGYYDYIKIDERDALQKRPFISQEKINDRIKTILSITPNNFLVWSPIMAAIDMHHEAVKIDNKTAVFRDFWIALESIFLNPRSSKTKNNTISSTVSIVQKTYILKRLRTVYHMINESTTDYVRQAIGIDSFEKFVQYFSKYSYDSDEMKVIYRELEENPLLRFRLYELRKSLSNGKRVLKLLDDHKKIVLWQINRIYRIRNIITHLGYEFPNIESALYNLHNYFDYVVNYIICCWENGKFSKSIDQLVFEIQNDNQLFRELLKQSDSLSDDNYIDVLFGGDSDLIHYEFEFND